MLLKDKVVLVVGAGGAIGSRLSVDMLVHGAVVIATDIDTQRIRTQIDELLSKENQKNLYMFQLDILNKKNIKEVFEGIELQGLSFNACVNMAYPRNNTWGIKFEDLEYESLSDNISMQLGGGIILAQQVLEYFKSQKKGGAFVQIASIQGLGAPKFEHYEGTSMYSPIEYTAVKAGIIAHTKWLAKYYKRNNIRVNCVSPGGILDSQPDAFLKRYKKDCLNKGMLDAKDISGAVMFLLSDLSTYINGQNLIVDDGWSL